MIEYKGSNPALIAQLEKYREPLQLAVTSVFNGKLECLTQEAERLLNMKSFDDFPNLDNTGRIFSRKGDSAFLLVAGAKKGTRTPIISTSGKIINGDRNFILQTTPSLLMTEEGAEYMTQATGNREIGHLAAYIHEAYGHFAFYALAPQSPAFASAFIMTAKKEATARCNARELELALLDLILYEENVVNSIQSVLLSRAGFPKEGMHLLKYQEVPEKISSAVKNNIERGNLDAVYNWQGKAADNKFTQNLGRTLNQVPHIKAAKV
jgi:hypothetical protein